MSYFLFLYFLTSSFFKKKLSTDKVQEVFMKKVKARDPFIDNARFLLVFLVVVGHFFSPIRRDYELIYDLNNIMGLFRMPALIMLTGFLSKGFMKPGYIEKIFKKILVPYLIFQFILGYYYIFLYDKQTFYIDFLRPQYTLWFLLSLFIWNMLLFIFTRIKFPILIAIIIGVLIGYSSGAGHYVSLHRTLVFFPFFLLGFYMKKEHLNWFKKPVAKIFAIFAFIIAWFVLDYLFTQTEALRWIYGQRNYVAMGYVRMDIGLVRLLIYGLSLMVAFGFLAFVPKKRTFFTHLGMRTAYIYILHAAIIRTLYKYYLNDWITEVWHLWMILIFALILTIILATKPVVFLTKPLIEGKIVDYIMKPIKTLNLYIHNRFERQISFIKIKLLIDNKDEKQKAS